MLTGGGGGARELDTEGPESLCENVALITVFALILFILLLCNRVTHVHSNV